MTKASTSRAKPEVASQAMELMEPENAWPLVPTNCSADRLVIIREPAMTMPGSPRPARK